MSRKCLLNLSLQKNTKKIKKVFLPFYFQQVNMSSREKLFLGTKPEKIDLNLAWPLKQGVRPLK